MQNRRLVLTAAAIAAALALAGCSSGGSGSTPTPTRSCSQLHSALLDISNGAQNTLAAAELPEDAPAYFEQLGERVDTLEDEWDDDEAVSDALEGVSDSLEAAEEYAAAPTDAVDPAALSTDIADSVSAVDEACSA